METSLPLFVFNICPAAVSFDVNAFHEYAYAFHTHFLIIVYTILLIDNIELLHRKNIALYLRKCDPVSLCKSIPRFLY